MDMDLADSYYFPSSLPLRTLMIKECKQWNIFFKKRRIENEYHYSVSRSIDIVNLANISFERYKYSGCHPSRSLPIDHPSWSFKVKMCKFGFGSCILSYASTTTTLTTTTTTTMTMTTKTTNRTKKRTDEEEAPWKGYIEGEGREGTRFFRGRDFETCLSALKSREIEEWRPKPGGGGQDRVQRLRQLGKCNDSRKKRRAEKTERGRRGERLCAKDGPTDESRRTQRRRSAKSSSPFVYTSRRFSLALPSSPLLLSVRRVRCLALLSFRTASVCPVECRSVDSGRGVRAGYWVSYHARVFLLRFRAIPRKTGPRRVVKRS